MGGVRIDLRSVYQRSFMFFEMFFPEVTSGQKGWSLKECVTKNISI